MVNTKPFIIDYSQTRVLIGCEFVDSKGEIFKSTKEMREKAGRGDYKVNFIVFCPACGAGNRQDVWGFPRTSGKRKLTVHKGQCPNCGERLSLKYCDDFDDISVVSCSVDNGPIAVAHISGRNPAYFASHLKWWDVEDGKLSIEAVYNLYFNRTMYGRYWTQREVLRYRYVFNLKTGQSYMMRGVDAKGNPSKHTGQIRRLQTYTFHSFYNVPSEMRPDFIRVVLDALREYKGVGYSAEMQDDTASIKQVYTSCGHHINFDNLCWLNYFSGMKESDIHDMLEFASYRVQKKSRKYFRNLIALSKDNEVEWLPKYMQKRSIRRRLNKRAIAFYLYRWLYASGIRDINIMNSIVDNYIDVVLDKTSPCQRPSSFKASGESYPLSEVVVHWCLDPMQREHAFLRWVSQGRSAESICQFVKSIFVRGNARTLFKDSARMFSTLPESARPENVGNLKELHDALSVADRKIRFGNREIEYTDVEKALEMDCGEYSFRLPKDTDSLYNIGKALSICVGSYGRDALAKRCTIMTMQKADKYVACIELRVSKKNVHMVQLKSRFNHTVQEIEPVIKWVANANVDPQCSDYFNAVERKTGGFDQYERDYHVENPRFVGRNVQGPFEDDGAFEWEPDEWDNEAEYVAALPF